MADPSPWARYGSTPVDPNTGKATPVSDPRWANYGSGGGSTSSPRTATGTGLFIDLGNGTGIWPGASTAARTQDQTTPTNLNPFGGTTYSGGGGGGGGGTPPPDYSAWGGWAAQAQPGMISYSPLEQQYLEWDPAMFDQARAGVATGIADARKRGGTAFDLAAQQYANYRNPYAAGPQATNPGVDPALIRSMQAWGGAGSGAAALQNNYANTADAAMGNIYDLLGSVGEQYNTDLRNAVQGDRMQFDQGMDMANNELNLATDMAKARAYADWRQRDMDARNQTAMMNWARRNQVNDQNTSTTNQWNSGVLDAILSMIGSGGTGIPVAGNDLSRLITMNPYQAV